MEKYSFYEEGMYDDKKPEREMFSKLLQTIDEIAAHTRDFSHELAAKKTYVVKK